jgi:nitroreductase
MNPITARRSIRKYKNTPVDKSTIEHLIQYASFAPSAKNRQPWKFVIYLGDEKEKLTNAMERGLDREANGKTILPDSAFGLPDAFHTLKIMKEAPVLIVVLNTNGDSPYEPINTDRRISEICDSLSIGAAIENMLLEATKLGLGTLWIANSCFAYPELVECVGTEDQLVSIVALGYPDESPDMSPRKAMRDIIEYRE